MNEKETTGLIGAILGSVVIFAILAIYTGFVVDVIEWGWGVGQSIISG